MRKQYVFDDVSQLSASSFTWTCSLHNAISTV